MGFLTDIFSPAAGLADLSGGEDAVFGTKPKIAPFVPVDLSDEARKAVAADLDNFPAITELLNKYVPGFQELLGSQIASSENLFNTGNQLLHGELPQDVIDQIQRGDAFKSLLGGFAGTPMSAALSLRDLGRTSLDVLPLGANLITSGANVASNAVSTTEGLYDPFVISTGQQAAVTAANNAGKQATDQFKFNVAAAPDPAALGTFNTNVAIGQQLVGIIGGIAGGGGFGGGGRSSTTGAQPTSWQNYIQPAPTNYPSNYAYQAPYNTYAWNNTGGYIPVG